MFSRTDSIRSACAEGPLRVTQKEPPMKRHVTSILPVSAVLLALLLFPASPASAGGPPTRFPLMATPFTYPAGLVCAFPLVQTPIVNNEVVTSFQPGPNGDRVDAVNGNLVVQFANGDTGASMTINVSGPGRNTFHPDGTVTAESSGNTVLFLFPGDTPSGPDTLVVSGRFVVQLASPYGPAAVQSLTGSRFDLCAALS